VKFLNMKNVPELKEDPRFDYMVGRLVGVTEMLSYYTTLHGDEKARGMALRAYETLSFFYDPKELSEMQKAYFIPADQEVTQEIQPGFRRGVAGQEDVIG